MFVGALKGRHIPSALRRLKGLFNSPHCDIVVLKKPDQHDLTARAPADKCKSREALEAVTLVNSWRNLA